MPIDPNLPELYRRLQEDYAKLDAECKKLKRALDIKEIEVRAILTQAHEIANTDVLTFLPNRRKIITDLQEEVIRSNRYGTPLTISILDIDHFKKVNDTYGHTSGDEALRSVAACLRDRIRHPDTIGRYGGEEFLIVLPNSISRSAVDQALRLFQAIRALKIETNGNEFSVTISMGIAQLRIGEENWEQFLHRADEALYTAKNTGRDRWVVSDE